MKLILKTILKYYLKYITRLVLLIHQPKIIAIAGSTNKTFVKDEIMRIVKEAGIDARANPKSYNTEIGMPLAILGLKSGYDDYYKWLTVIKEVFFSLSKPKFPELLVLELGISDPGDMKYLLTIIKPRAAIITDITQRYLESFSDMDELSCEYEFLVKALKSDALLFLNSDNTRIKPLGDITKAHVINFGFKPRADYLLEVTEKNKFGQAILIKHNTNISKLSTARFGVHHVYTLAVGYLIDKYVLANR